jgi:NADPH:quinone reductase-like Zn-dependent oxidoreductase
MKSMIVRAPGGLENLTLIDTDVPEVGDNDLLVRVHASSLNFHDYVVATVANRAPDGRVLMSDGAGEVVEAGKHVTEFAVGDPVVSTFFPHWQSGQTTAAVTSSAVTGDTVDGYASEYVVRPANWFTKTPAGYSHAEAATLPCAALTAWRGLIDAGNIKRNDVVLIQGTGGVSIFGLQLAKSVGAVVIATSSSEEKLRRLRALGADHVINYRETPEWGAAAKKLTDGRGVDHVLEVGGAGTLPQSIRACRMHGHIALVGVLTGFSGEIPTALFAITQLKMNGIYVGSRADQQAMIRDIENWGIKPVIDSSFPLAAMADAFRHQASQKHFGKIVVEY